MIIASFLGMAFNQGAFWITGVLLLNLCFELWLPIQRIRNWTKRTKTYKVNFWRQASWRAGTHGACAHSLKVSKSGRFVLGKGLAVNIWVLFSCCKMPVLIKHVAVFCHDGTQKWPCVQTRCSVLFAAPQISLDLGSIRWDRFDRLPTAQLSCTWDQVGRERLVGNMVY